jgi:hypothetical protein
MAQEIRKPMAGGAPVSRYRDPIAEMRSEMDRLFDTFLGRSFFGRPAPSGSAEPATTLAPMSTFARTTRKSSSKRNCRGSKKKIFRSPCATACCH